MLFHLATSEGFGLVKNHHGDRFQAPEAEAVVQTLALAAGEISEAADAEWLQGNSKRAGARRA